MRYDHNLFQVMFLNDLTLLISRYLCSFGHCYTDIFLLTLTNPRPLKGEEKFNKNVYETLLVVWYL